MSLWQTPQACTRMRTRFGNLALNYFETCSRLRNLCHLHRSYCVCCCHEPSFEVPAIVGKAFTTAVEAAEPCSPHWLGELLNAANTTLNGGGFVKNVEQASSPTLLDAFRIASQPLFLQ